MHSSGSFILTALERIRAFLDEPSLDAKYSNDFLIRHALCPAYSAVWSELNYDMASPVVVRHTINVQPDVAHYQLPPTFGSVWRVTLVDSSTGLVIADARPRGEFHPLGPGWTIENHTFTLRPTPKIPQEVVIWYTPSGDASLVYATGPGAHQPTQSTPSQVQFPVNVTAGYIDYRPHAYVGFIVRRTGPGGPWEERIIDTWNNSTRTLTTRIPFSFTGATAFEIAPPCNQPLWDVMALRASFRMAAIGNVSSAKREAIRVEYAMAMKSCRDQLCATVTRVPPSFNRDTVDNPEGTIGLYFDT